MPPIERSEGWTRSTDGTALFWRAWRTAAPRASLLLVHGLGEHSGRYDHVGSFFAGRGIDCWAGDYRGHGLSPGPRVHVDDFSRYVEDVGAFLALASAGAGPRFLCGHSQGGLIVLLRALRHPDSLRGVIASSPYLAVHPKAAPSGVKLGAASVLMRVAPGFLVATGLDTGVLSHDPAVEKAYLADPLVSKTVSPAWLRAARRAQEEVSDGAPLFPVPLLLMAAGDDELVDPAAIRAWAERAPAPGTTFVEWAGMYHELFNEVGRGKVLGRIAEWVRERS